jgi:prevent-host-death family protein
VIHLDNIRSLTEFQRHTGQFVAHMKQTGQPLVLTVNGKAELVVQDAKSYQQLLDHLERLRDIEALLVGLDEVQQGSTRPAGEALQQLRQKLNVQG